MSKELDLPGAVAVALAVKDMAEKIMLTIKDDAEKKFQYNGAGKIVEAAEHPDACLDPVDISVFHMMVFEDAVRHASNIVPLLLGEEGLLTTATVSLAAEAVGHHMSGAVNEISDGLPDSVAATIQEIPVMRMIWDDEELRPVFVPESIPGPKAQAPVA